MIYVFFSLGLLGYHTKYDLYGLLWLIFNYDLVIHLLIVIFRDGLLGLPHLNLIMKRQEHLVSTTTDQTTTSLASIGDLHWPESQPRGNSRIVKAMDLDFCHVFIFTG